MRSSPKALAASRRAEASACGQIRRGVDDAHPLAAAARGRLDQQRIAEFRRGGQQSASSWLAW
jgi:hypothetical protein